MARAPAGRVGWGSRSSLVLQRSVAYALAPLTLPAVAGILRFGLGYRDEGLRELRRE